MRTLFKMFIELLERFVGKRFAANVAKLMSGTVLAMAINFLITPLLTRIYTPEMFGVFGTITALVGTFSGVAALRFGMAVVIPKEDEDAMNLIALAAFALLATTVINTIIFVGFGDQIARLYGDIPSLTDWLWVVPILIALTGIYGVCRYWCTRTQRFGTISGAAVTASVLSSGSKFGAGRAGFGVSGLVLGQLFGQFCATMWLAGVTIFGTRHLAGAISREKMREMAKTYVDFPKFNVPVTLINASSKNLPIFGLGWFFTADVVGWYSMAYMVLKLPVFLVSDALRQVYFQKANETFLAGGNLAAEVIRLTLILFGLGVVPAAGFMIFSPVILEAFLGPRWLMAGEYARYLTPYLFSLLVVSPAATVLPVLNLQRAQLIWQCLFLTCTTGALFVGGTMEEATTAIGLFSGAGSFLNVVLIGYVLWVLKSNRTNTGYGQSE